MTPLKFTRSKNLTMPIFKPFSSVPNILSSSLKHLEPESGQLFYIEFQSQYMKNLSNPIMLFFPDQII